MHTAQQDMLRAGLTAQKAEASARKVLPANRTNPTGLLPCIQAIVCWPNTSKLRTMQLERPLNADLFRCAVSFFVIRIADSVLYIIHMLPVMRMKYLRRVFLTINCRSDVQAAEVAESRAWAVELQRQAAAYRAEQTAKRTKSAAAFADLKVSPSHLAA